MARALIRALDGSSATLTALGLRVPATIYVRGQGANAHARSLPSRTRQRRAVVLRSESGRSDRSRVAKEAWRPDLFAPLLREQKGSAAQKERLAACAPCPPVLCQ